MWDHLWMQSCTKWEKAMSLRVPVVYEVKDLMHLLRGANPCLE